MRGFGIMVLAGVLAIASSATPAAADVRVTKRPAEVERRTFDPFSPPDDLPPLKPGEAAVTTYRFDCDTSLSAAASKYPLAGGGCRTTLSVQGVRLVLRLRVTVWLPEGASDKLWAHEDGHREIAERMYLSAEAAAHRAADRADGRRVVGEGDDCEKAANERLNELAKQIGEQYRELVIAPTKRVQDVYDELTAHGANADPAEKAAIKAAFERYAEETKKAATTKPATRRERPR